MALTRREGERTSIDCRSISPDTPSRAARGAPSGSRYFLVNCIKTLVFYDRVKLPTRAFSRGRERRDACRFTGGKGEQKGSMGARRMLRASTDTQHVCDFASLRVRASKKLSYFDRFDLSSIMRDFAAMKEKHWNAIKMSIVPINCAHNERWRNLTYILFFERLSHFRHKSIWIGQNIFWELKCRKFLEFILNIFYSN